MFKSPKSSETMKTVFVNSPAGDSYKRIKELSPSLKQQSFKSQTTAKAYVSHHIDDQKDLYRDDDFEFDDSLKQYQTSLID